MEGKSCTIWKSAAKQQFVQTHVCPPAPRPLPMTQWLCSRRPLFASASSWHCCSSSIPRRGLDSPAGGATRGVAVAANLNLLDAFWHGDYCSDRRKNQAPIVHDFSSSSGKLFFLRICTGTDGRGSPFLYGSDRRASAARLTVGVEKQACATELCGGASVNTIRTFPRHIWRKRKAVGRSSIDSTGRQVAQFQGVFTPARPIFTGTKWRGLSRERDTPF